MPRVIRGVARRDSSEAQQTSDIIDNNEFTLTCKASARNTAPEASTSSYMLSRCSSFVSLKTTMAIPDRKF